MTADDLVGLPEEVREAFVAIDDRGSVFVDGDDCIGGNKWSIVRAELLRLARENASLRSQLGHYAVRAERAESDRDALRKRLKNSLVEVTYTSEIGYVVNGDEQLLDAACGADCVALVPLDDAEAKG